VLFGRGESHVSLAMDDTPKLYKACTVINEQSISNKQAINRSLLLLQSTTTNANHFGGQTTHTTARSKSTRKSTYCNRKRQQVRNDTFELHSN
jgi:hypothetical protein